MKVFPELSQKRIDPRTYPYGVAYMDGQYLPIKEAAISVLDYGFLHSDATYDVAHVWDGAFFRLEDHLNRFFTGMQQLHMSIPYNRQEIIEILHNCVGLSGLKNSYVEFICTRGMSSSFSRDPRDAENRFIAFAIPFGSVANDQQMELGLKISVSDIVRIPPTSVDPTIKNYHWLDMVNALYQAYDKGAETTLLLDTNGNVAEGPGFNIFSITAGKVLTPDKGVLMGITRRTAMEICEHMGLEISAEPVSIEHLMNSDEVFITSTAGGIMPVSQIDNRAIASGKVGVLTQKITDAYWQLHNKECYRSAVVYPDPDK